jgi:hypothetical protein
MEVGVSDIPRCINDISKYLVLKSLNDVSVALIRASPQLHVVGPHRLQYLFVQHQLIVYRQARETLSPGTFIYNIILRYTHICTSVHYNIRDVSEPTRAAGQVRVSSAVDMNNFQPSFSKGNTKYPLS